MEIGILKNTATVEGCRKMLIELKTPVQNPLNSAWPCEISAQPLKK